MALVKSAEGTKFPWSNVVAQKRCAPSGRLISTIESIPFLVEICGSGLVLNLYVARKPQFLLQGLSQCR